MSAKNNLIANLNIEINDKLEDSGYKYRFNPYYATTSGDGWPPARRNNHWNPITNSDVVKTRADFGAHAQVTSTPSSSSVFEMERPLAKMFFGHRNL